MPSKTALYLSVLSYLVALTLPAAYGPLSKEVIWGWQCLLHGYDFPFFWAANPLLFVSWILSARGSRLALLPVVLSLAGAIYFFATLGSDLIGSFVWLLSTGLGVAAGAVSWYSAWDSHRAGVEVMSCQS